MGKITLETNRTDDQQITLPAGAIITDIVLDNPSEPLGKTYFLTVSSVTGTPTIGNSVEGDISGSSGVITGITGSILNVTTTEGVSPFQNSESITIQGGSTAVVDSFTTNTPCETLELWKSVSRSGSNNQIAFSGGYSLQYILFPDDYLSFFSGVRTGELSFFRKTGTASYLSFSQASDFAATVDISIYGYPTTAHL